MFSESILKTFPSVGCEVELTEQRLDDINDIIEQGYELVSDSESNESEGEETAFEDSDDEDSDNESPRKKPRWEGKDLYCGCGRQIRIHTQQCRTCGKSYIDSKWFDRT